MHVRDVMTNEPRCCLPDTPLTIVGRMMAELDCGAIPVVGDLATRIPLGMITDRDIVTRVIATGRDPFDLTVRDCMTAPVVTIEDDARIDDCIERLQLTQIRRIIVVDRSGACVGIVSQADLALHTSSRVCGELVRELSQRAVLARATPH